MMGDDQGRLRQAGQDFLDLAAHDLPQLDIESAQWLIEEEAVGLAHDGAGHGNPLLLAFGQVPRQTVQVRDQFEPLGDLADPGRNLGPGQRLGVQRKSEILGHREAGIECVELEHHGDIAFRGLEPVDSLAADADVPLARAFEPGDHA
jgi:hypothetical protein